MRSELSKVHASFYFVNNATPPQTSQCNNASGEIYLTDTVDCVNPGDMRRDAFDIPQFNMFLCCSSDRGVGVLYCQAVCRSHNLKNPTFRVPSRTRCQTTLCQRPVRSEGEKKNQHDLLDMSLNLHTHTGCFSTENDHICSLLWAWKTSLEGRDYLFITCP